MKGKISLTLAALMCFAALAGCGGGGDSGSKRLLVDLHSLMPTPSETPTPDQPHPINASRYIAREYEKATGTKIQWASDYAKPYDNLINMKQWYNTQVNVKNCPAIGFSFGSGMQEDDMYIDLTEYLERPNPYAEGNKKWKDCFEDWVWTDPYVLDANGKIISIPVILNPGTATAIYYNKARFEEQSLEIPSTWKEFLNVSDELKKAPGMKYSYAPYTGDMRTSLDSWVFDYSLAPGFAVTMMDRTDYDKDGITTTNELIRAVMEDVFNPNTCREAQTLYRLAYQYYKTVLPTGWESITTFEKEWDAGKLGMKNQGLWFYTIESGNTVRDFDFGIFAPPVVQSDTSPYAADIEKKTIVQGHQSDVLMSYNVMKPAVENNPELLESAIDFLMYITTPDAVTALCQENGIGLSAVKGAGVPSVFDDSGWLEKEFFEIGGIKWPLGFISSNTANINAAFNDWVLGDKTEQEFRTILHREQKAGAETMIKNMKIDTSSWSIKA